MFCERPRSVPRRACLGNNLVDSHESTCPKWGWRDRLVLVKGVARESIGEQGRFPFGIFARKLPKSVCGPKSAVFGNPPALVAIEGKRALNPQRIPRFNRPLEHSRSEVPLDAESCVASGYRNAQFNNRERWYEIT